jgi:hypothetical protein
MYPAGLLKRAAAGRQSEDRQAMLRTIGAMQACAKGRSACNAPVDCYCFV